MVARPEKLWDLHSHVAEFVIPSKKLCRSLLEMRRPTQRILDDLSAIEPSSKIRKSKGYYEFGRAYIKAHAPACKLNPLKANLHHRLVAHAEGFLKELNELRPGDGASFNWARAREIAASFYDGFADCTLQKLKTEVEAACALIEQERQRAEVTQVVQFSRRAAENSPQSGMANNLSGTLTVPELAKEWKIGRDKIYAWISAGELKATNVSKNKAGRPRYSIKRSDAEQFCQKRANVVTATKTTVACRRQRTSKVTKYF